MESTDAIFVSNMGASTSTATSTLKGGFYAFSAVATWGTGAALALQQMKTLGLGAVNIPTGQGFNNSAAATTTITANTTALVVALPPGQYKLASVSNTTAIYARVVRIPRPL